MPGGNWVDAIGNNIYRQKPICFSGIPDPLGNGTVEISPCGGLALRQFSHKFSILQQNPIITAARKSSRTRNLIVERRLNQSKTSIWRLFFDDRDQFFVTRSIGFK